MVNRFFCACGTKHQCELTISQVGIFLKAILKFDLLRSLPIGDRTHNTKFESLPRNVLLYDLKTGSFLSNSDIKYGQDRSPLASQK